MKRKDRKTIEIRTHIQIFFNIVEEVVENTHGFLLVRVLLTIPLLTFKRSKKFT